jgi:hypothetical protein
MAKQMSKSLRDKLTAVIGPLLRFKRPGRETLHAQGDPMKSECITLAAESTYAPAVRTGNGVAPLETVARSLGYTEKERLFAENVLDRFVWRNPTESVRLNGNSVEEEAIDSLRGQDYAA